MTGTSGLSMSNLAIISAAGVFGLIALMVIIAYLCDLPKRMRKKRLTKDGGKSKPNIDDEEMASEITQISQGTKSSQTTVRAVARVPL
jgi:predicted RND superfamily exporter protein